MKIKLNIKLSSIFIFIFSYFSTIKVYADTKNNISTTAPLYKITNVINNFYTNHKTIIFIVLGIISISLLDAFYCFIINAKEQKKYLKQLDVERERYNIVIEQLNDIIFDFDIAQKRILSSSKFEEKFGWTLSIKNYNKNFLHEFKVHPDDKVLINKVIADMTAMNKQSIIKQIRLMKSNGEYLWCELKLNYIQRNNKIVRVIGKITDIDYIVRENSILKMRSEYDQLTEIYNKSTFYDKVKEYLLNNKNDNCILIFIDLDNFKAINDNLGHMTGDEVLKDTANKICDVFSGTDSIISRFGGDEFFIFRPILSLSFIKEKIAILCESLNATYSNKDIQIAVSASIGIAFYPKDGTTLESLIYKSDLALYSSKRKGKNQFTIYNKKLEITG